MKIHIHICHDAPSPLSLTITDLDLLSTRGVKIYQHVSMRTKKTSAKAKMFVKMVAKLIFERAVMLGIFIGNPVFIKSTKCCDLEVVIVS